jgi:hypothetical protein
MDVIPLICSGGRPKASSPSSTTGLVHAIPGIISPDRAFDNVPGLQRWDPTAFLDTLV